MWSRVIDFTQVSVTPNDGSRRKRRRSACLNRCIISIIDSKCIHVHAHSRTIPPESPPHQINHPHQNHTNATPTKPTRICTLYRPNAHTPSPPLYHPPCTNPVSTSRQCASRPTFTSKSPTLASTRPSAETRRKSVQSRNVIAVANPSSSSGDGARTPRGSKRTCNARKSAKMVERTRKSTTASTTRGGVLYGATASTTRRTRSG